MPERHPLGRNCGDKKTLLLVLISMPYAVVMALVDAWRGGAR